MACRAISAAKHRCAAYAFALLAAATPRAHAAELPAGFEPPQQTPESYHLTLTVKDETGLAVSSARVTLTPPGSQTPLQASTDFAGRAEFTGLAAGAYSISVEKEGFYAQMNIAAQAG